MSGWIRVVDGLPDDDITVIVCDADGDVGVGFLEAGCWYDFTAFPYNPEITHWMHLPEAPEVKREVA